MSARERKHCVIVAPPDAEAKTRCFAKKSDAKKYAASKVKQLGSKAVELATAPPSGGG